MKAKILCTIIIATINAKPIENRQLEQDVKIQPIQKTKILKINNTIEHNSNLQQQTNYNKFIPTFNDNCKENVRKAVEQAISYIKPKLTLHTNITMKIRCEKLQGKTLGLTVAPTFADPFNEQQTQSSRGKQVKIEKAFTQALLKQRLEASPKGRVMRYNQTHTLLQYYKGQPDMTITIQDDLPSNDGVGWHTPVDETPMGRNQLDMVATALHEIAHGLGFSSTSGTGGRFSPVYTGSHPADWPIPADFNAYDPSKPGVIHLTDPIHVRAYDHYLTLKNDPVPYLENPIYLRFVQSIPKTSTPIVEWLDGLEKNDYEAYVYARILQNSFQSSGNIFFQSRTTNLRSGSSMIALSANPSQIDLSHLEPSEPDSINAGWMAPGLPRGLSLSEYHSNGKLVVPPQVLDVLDTLGWNVPYDPNDSMDNSRYHTPRHAWQMLLLIATIIFLICLFSFFSCRCHRERKHRSNFRSHRYNGHAPNSRRPIFHASYRSNHYPISHAPALPSRPTNAHLPNRPSRLKRPYPVRLE